MMLCYLFLLNKLLIDFKAQAVESDGSCYIFNASEHSHLRQGSNIPLIWSKKKISRRDLPVSSNSIFEIQV